jgi:SEC-C motif
MPSPGRNEPCACGSGRKTKRCCGVQRGPSEEQLARAHLAVLATDAAWELIDLSDRELDRLWENLRDLPMVDPSLHAVLPEISGEELDRLQGWLADGGAGGIWDLVSAIAARTDTARERARLADALVRLRDGRRITPAQAAHAIYDLERPRSRFFTSTVIDAVAEHLADALRPERLAA